MRTLTKLESALMDITPTESATISAVLAGGKVHPMRYKKGVGQYYELLGVGRGRIVKVLEIIAIRGKDLEFGNDAPRGGITGEWVKLTSSGRRKSARRLA